MTESPTKRHNSRLQHHVIACNLSIKLTWIDGLGPALWRFAVETVSANPLSSSSLWPSCISSYRLARSLPFVDVVGAADQIGATGLFLAVGAPPWVRRAGCTETSDDDEAELSMEIGFRLLLLLPLFLLPGAAGTRAEPSQA